MTAEIVIPSTNIYRNKENGTYLVQELVSSPLGGSVECGEPVTVEESEFDSRIAKLVFDALSNYENREDNLKLEHRFRNDRQSLAFAKQHLLVNVAKIPGDRIRVAALQRKGGSFVGGVVDGETVLDHASARQELTRALRDAFGKAR